MQISSSLPVGVATPRTAAGTANPEDAKLRATCADMEAVFMNMLLAQMRQTVPKNSLYGGGQAEDIMQSMLDGEMTKNMAKAGGMGLADLLYRQLAPTVTANTNKGQAPR